MELAVIPETKELQERTHSALEIAEAIIIRDSATYGKACDFLKTLKALENEIETKFEKSIRTAFEAHKSILALKKETYQPLEIAERKVKPKIAAYQEEQERIRREEERRLQEEARKQAEEEALAQAAELEAEGNKEGAESLISEPIQVAPVVLPKSTPKVSGIATREVWQYRITDVNKIPRQYWKLDEQKIGGVVRAMKGATQIPGIEVYAEKQIAAGRF